jgi:hypothetical protein
MQVHFEEVLTIVEAGELRLPLGMATLAPVDIADIAKVAFATLVKAGRTGRCGPRSAQERG